MPAAQLLHRGIHNSSVSGAVKRTTAGIHSSYCCSIDWLRRSRFFTYVIIVSLPTALLRARYTVECVVVQQANDDSVRNHLLTAVDYYCCCPPGWQCKSQLLLPVVAEEAVYRRSTYICYTQKKWNGIGNMHTKNNPGSAARTAETLRGDGRIYR